MMRDIELLLILGLYYFDGGKNIEKFTSRFNQYFKKDVSSQTVLFSLSRFRNIDPSNNIMPISNDEYKVLWDEYIGRDNVKDLNELYRSFKKGLFINPLQNIDDALISKNLNIKNPKAVVINDYPQERPHDFAIKGLAAYKRSQEVASNAVAAANFICEAGCTTELFVRKDGKTNYTEAHHLIPLSFQDEFKYSLDVEGNVISLCPNCHSKLHFGADIESTLEILFNLRKNRLMNCGLDISFEKLLLLYR